MVKKILSIGLITISLFTLISCNKEVKEEKTPTEAIQVEEEKEFTREEYVEFLKAWFMYFGVEEEYSFAIGEEFTEEHISKLALMAQDVTNLRDKVNQTIPSDLSDLFNEYADAREMIDKEMFEIQKNESKARVDQDKVAKGSKAYNDLAKKLKEIIKKFEIEDEEIFKEVEEYRGKIIEEKTKANQELMKGSNQTNN